MSRTDIPKISQIIKSAVLFFFLSNHNEMGKLLCKSSTKASLSGED